MQGIIGRRVFFSKDNLRPYIGHEKYLDLRIAREMGEGVYDSVLQHVVVNIEGLDTMKSVLDTIVGGGQLVSIVRDPVARAISHWYYFQEPSSDQSLEKRSSAEYALRALRSKNFLDNVAKDLLISGRSNFETIIRDIDNFDLLILERFDESLVLRHFFWGWKLEELLYLKVNSCGSNKWDGKLVLCPPASLKDNWPQDLAERIVYSTPIDSLIYQRALEVHEAAILMVQPEVFQNAFTKFQQMQRTWQNACSGPEIPHLLNVTTVYQLLSGERRKGFPSFTALISDPIKYCPIFWTSMEQMLRIDNAVSGIS